jgi:Cu/Zn superoxide dismutase
MQRRFLLGPLLLLSVLALAACGGGGNGGEAEAAEDGAMSNDEVMVELAEENGSGESGTATLTAMGDQTRVVLELQNTTTSSQPAHIHEGNCGPSLDPAPLHGLQNVIDGRSDTVVDRPLSELTAGGLAINIHQSNDDLETFVACGNLPGGAADAGSSDDGGFGY